MKITIEIVKNGKAKITAEGKHWELKRSMPELSFLTNKAQDNAKSIVRMDNLFRDWCEEHNVPF